MRIFSEQDEIDIARKYQSGKTANEIADEYYCTKCPVIDALERQGVKRRGQGKGKKSYEHIKWMLINDWNAGKDSKSMAKVYGMKVQNMRSLLSMWRNQGLNVKRRKT